MEHENASKYRQADMVDILNNVGNLLTDLTGDYETAITNGQKLDTEKKELEL
jgi:hypothetical protein